MSEMKMQMQTKDSNSLVKSKDCKTTELYVSVVYQNVNDIERERKYVCYL